MFNNFNSAFTAEQMTQLMLLMGFCLVGSMHYIYEFIAECVKLMVKLVKKLWNKIKNSKSEDNEEA